MNGEVCVWVNETNEDYEIWDTNCDECFFLEEGSPQQNSYNYCPNCGRKIYTYVIDNGEDAVSFIIEG